MKHCLLCNSSFYVINFGQESWFETMSDKLNFYTHLLKHTKELARVMIEKKNQNNIEQNNIISTKLILIFLAKLKSCYS